MMKVPMQLWCWNGLDVDSNNDNSPTVATPGSYSAETDADINSNDSDTSAIPGLGMQQSTQPTIDRSGKAGMS